jgi:xanthine dehydrogenase accessory factor
MTDELLEKLREAQELGRAHCVVTVAQTKGSTPRHAGAKMLVYGDGRTWGTIGGGKFEALVIEASLAAIATREPLLKTFPLHEADAESFGAICGGEVTVFIEPRGARDSLVIVGAGHCGSALARLARDCGMRVTLLDDRELLETEIPGVDRLLLGKAPADSLCEQAWPDGTAIVLVSRNFEVDREALAVALRTTNAGYIGMIGSKRKVDRVFAELRERGVTDTELARVHAPIGLDIGADSPMEIAVSIMAELLKVLRGRTGTHLRQGA